MHAPHDATTTYVKADLAKRCLAYFIDSIVAGLAGLLVGWILPAFAGLASAGYFLVRDGLEVDFMHHRSLGKHLLNLRVVRMDGAPMDLETSVRRNWMFALSGLAQSAFIWGLGPALAFAGTVLFVYEVYRLFTDDAGRRWGDEMAHTAVVE